VVLVLGLASFALIRSAGADAGVTLTSPSPNPPSGDTVTAGTPYVSGQTIDISVPLSVLQSAGMVAGNSLAIEECAAPGGVDPSTPVGNCDGNTHQAGTVLVNSTTGLDFTGYPVFALPDPNLSEFGGTPACDLTDECVLYIGTNQNLASAPHIYSNGFFVTPGDGTDDGDSPGDGSAPTVTAVSPTLSTVVPSQSSVVADGAESTTVTVTLLGTNSGPLAGKNVTLSAGSGGSKITPTAVGGAAAGTTDGSGVATFTVSDTNAEKVVYTATDTSDSNTVITQTASVTFASPVVTASESSTIADPTALPADGTSVSTVTVTLHDQANVPVGGKTVSLDVGSSHAQVTPATGTSDPTTGTVTFSVVDSQAETVTATGVDDTDGDLQLPQATINFESTVAVPVDPALSTVTGPSMAAVGSGTATVTVTLLGAGSVPEANKTVTLAASSASATISPSSGMTGPDGSTTFSVGDPTAESVQFTATDTSDTPNVAVSQQATISFSQPTTSAASAVTVTPAGTVPADGETAADISVSLVNTGGAVVAGDTLVVTPSSGSSATVTAISVGGSSAGVTNGQGIAEFQVRDEVAETVTFTVTDQTASNLQLTQTATVTFTPGIGDGEQSTVTASPPGVAVGGTSTVSVEVFDHLGNPVPGLSVTLAAASGSSATITPATQTTDENGTATFTVTDTKTEAVVFSATDTTDSVPISDTATVTFGTPVVLPDVASSVVLSNTSSVPANGTQTATVTVELFDASGNPLSGKQITLAASAGQSVITGVTGPTASARAVSAHRDKLLPRATTSTPTATTGTDGSASFLVSDTVPETVTYTATDTSDNVPITGQSTQVTFTAAAASTTTTTTAPTTTATTSPSSTTSSTSAASAAAADDSAGSSGTSSSGGGASGSGASGSDATGAASSGGLAFTGAGASIPWLLGFGLLLLLVGTTGRRLFSLKSTGGGDE
jgi:hypothetical protein